MECLSYCITDKINLHQLESLLSKDKEFMIERLREVIHGYLPDSTKEFFIFKNGTLVTWGYKRHQAKSLLTKLAVPNQFSLQNIAQDEFSIKFGKQTKFYPDNYFNVDRLHIDSDDLETKLAISYGLSNSIKLNFYENKLEQLINKNRPLLETGYQKGGFNVSHKKINKILSEIITVKNNLNLSSEILYQPKFFWSYPNLEEYYIMTSNYLDIQTRIQTINQQLESLNETFELFNGYLISRHSHYLEIIIVILILMEIVFNVLNLHLNW